MSYTDNNKGSQMFNDVRDIDYAPEKAAGVSVEIGRGSGCIILSALVSTGRHRGDVWYERISYYGYTVEELEECLESYLDHLTNMGFFIRDEEDDE